MNTFLSAPQQATKEQFQAFAREHVAAVAGELDKQAVSSQEILQKIGQKGYLGLTVPSEYGGQGAPFLATIWLAQALGEHDPGLAMALAEHTAVVELIKKCGSDQQKSRYLPLLARGDAIGTMAVHEQDAGSDVNACKCTAATQGNGFVLNGTKTWVANAQAATLFVVAARQPEQESLSLFLIDSGEDLSSLSILPEHAKMGMRSVSAHDVLFTKHLVKRESLLRTASSAPGEELGFAQDVAKTVLAAAALGMLDSSIAASVGHANTREQFGQKLGQFQAIQWKIADMSAETEACRMLVYRAAWSKDEQPEDFRKDAAMAKWYAAKTARVYTGEATQILGLSGIAAGSATERFYRDAKMMEIYLGTSEWQKIVLSSALDV